MTLDGKRVVLLCARSGGIGIGVGPGTVGRAMMREMT